MYVEVLDGSRIHNEAYEWARKMAVDALEYEEEDGNPASALEQILKEPEKLSELDLDAFAQELERQGFGKKGITLQVTIIKHLVKSVAFIKVLKLSRIILRQKMTKWLNITT